MKQHIRAIKDLTVKQIINIFCWFFTNRKKWKKYNRMIQTCWYGNIAYMIAKREK